MTTTITVIILFIGFSIILLKALSALKKSRHLERVLKYIDLKAWEDALAILYIMNQTDKTVSDLIFLVKMNKHIEEIQNIPIIRMKDF